MKIDLKLNREVLLNICVRTILFRLLSTKNQNEIHNILHNLLLSVRFRIENCKNVFSSNRAESAQQFF